MWRSWHRQWLPRGWLVRQRSAGWELVQFEEVELVDEETWKLTRLLRGQQGAEPAMASGAEAGARILFLTGAEQRLDLADWELGLDLVRRVWRERREQRLELAKWNERDLHDVGLSWSDIAFEAEKPFWRA